MRRVYRVSEIRAAEERAAARNGWDALMQRAATGLAAALDDLAPGTPVAFLIGPGNNGGDALFAAAQLCGRGVIAHLCVLDPERVHAAGLETALQAGARRVDGPTDEPVWVDALFGIGARGGLRDTAAAWAALAEDRRPAVVAVDVPSGIGVDDGTVDGPVLAAQRTVTFGAPKVGLLAGPAAALAGDVTVVDIGLSPDHPAAEVIETGDGRMLDPTIPAAAAHKYTRGVLGIAAGSAQYAGAAHLCVAGAQAGPAGMIRIAGDPDLQSRVVDRAPEVVAQAGRVQAWVVGPGGGDATEAQLATAVDDEVPVVVDAEALRHVGDHRGLRGVLTPHAGELARLLDVAREAVEADPWGFVHQAAERFEATVLLKGHRTLIATPGELTRVNTTGTPWLATAGAGDVLAGFIGSLLASGMAPHDAASLGAHLHGLAAERAGTEAPIVASDVAARLSGAFADFREGEPS